MCSIWEKMNFQYTYIYMSWADGPGFYNMSKSFPAFYEMLGKVPQYIIHDIVLFNTLFWFNYSLYKMPRGIWQSWKFGTSVSRLDASERFHAALNIYIYTLGKLIIKGIYHDCVYWTINQWEIHYWLIDRMLNEHCQCLFVLLTCNIKIIFRLKIVVVQNE